MGAHLGLGVGVGTVVEQDLGHTDLVLLSGQVQRRQAALHRENQRNSHIRSGISLLALKANIGVTFHLVAHVDIGVLDQQERHQVHAALLRRQVDGADALPRHCVGVGAVLQQRGPDVHLVLLGGDVEGCVAVLEESSG